MSSVSTSSSHWLSEAICDLMSSPHISTPAHGGMHLGPGPVDVFTTRFNKYFTTEAHGAICGSTVDREGIKASLLALQKTWNPNEVLITQEGSHNGFPLQHNMLSTGFEWTPLNSHTSEAIVTQASVCEDEGQEQIRFLKIEGNPALFRV